MIDGIRDNQIAMYINAAFFGGIGWHGMIITRDGDRAVSGITHNADDSVAVRVAWSYYESGPSIGLCKAAAVSYSEDYNPAAPAAATWADIGALNYSYDVDGNLTGATWAYA